MSDEQIYEFMREVDADMDNRISLQEFRDRFSLAFTSTTGDAWAEGVVEDIGERLAAKGLDLEATFLQWDTNGDGRISHSEFKEAVEEVGMAFNSDELRRLFATLDADNVRPGRVCCLSCAEKRKKKNHPLGCSPPPCRTPYRSPPLPFC